MPEVITIESVKQFNELVSSTANDVLLALSFHTQWAVPCKQMNQVFSELAAQPRQGTPITFVSIDAEDLPDISESYEVSAVPFFVLLKSGKTLKKISGADRTVLAKALEQLSGSTPSLPPAQAAVPPINGQVAAGGEGAGGEGPAEGVGEEDLNTRLSKLVKAAPVMLFMKGTPAEPRCGFSRQLVALLRERGVRYGFFNILADDEVRQGLKTFSDWPTYPQLYVDGQLVGGLDIVKEEFENDPVFLKDYSVS